MMSDNIGSKIKTLSIILCVLEVISCVAYGVILIMTDTAFIGVLSIIIGIFFSCAASFALYGLGHLIETTDTMASQMRTIQSRQNEKPAIIRVGNVGQESAPNVDPEHKWICESCGRMRSSNPCPYCGN